MEALYPILALTASVFLVFGAMSKPLRTGIITAPMLCVAAGVIAEGAHVAVRLQLPGPVHPCRTPAEAREAEPLEALGERPELVEAERFAGPGDELLAHGRE